MTNNLNDLFARALNIGSPWFIKEVAFDKEKKCLDIHIDFKRGTTFHYNDEETGTTGDYKVHDTRNKTWRHLNFFEHKCYLHCRTPRVKTDSGKVRFISPPWAGINSGFTMLFEAYILQLCREMPVNSLARLIDETDDKIWRLLQKYVDEAREEEDFSEVKCIGTDETSRAGHHDYITLVVDLKERRTIFISRGKDSGTLKEFADDLKKHNGDPDQITDVSCDMSPAFIKGVKSYMPKAEITFDRFHIMKIINQAVEKVRKQELAVQGALLSNKFIFLKNRSNLTPKQKKQLEDIENMPKLNLKTIRALHIRENFQSIYDASDMEDFTKRLKKWYFWATHSRLEPMKQAAYTIKKHWDGIVNWKRSQINNGILEGLNSLVQAAKAKARGFRTFINLRTITYLLTGKLDFSRINPSYHSL